MDGTMYVSNSSLPPGFRFHPTDEELIIHYLKQKILCPSNPLHLIIADVNIYKFNPWELPGKAFFGETEWFFFSPRDRKYPNGERPNRAAASGYWKATGTDKPILSCHGSQFLGVKKALVFYKGRPPKGEKTNWMMHEYRLVDDSFKSPRLKGSMRLDDWVLCRVRQKNQISSQQGGGGIHAGSCSSSPASTVEHLQGQEIADTNVLTKYYEYEFQLRSLMGPIESEEGSEEIPGQASAEFPESSPEYPMFDHSNGSPAASTDSSLTVMLKSIETALCVGTLDELVPTQTNAFTSSAHHTNSTPIFPAYCPPTTSPSYMHQCF